jgi:hypothetical protein
VENVPFIDWPSSPRVARNVPPPAALISKVTALPCAPTFESGNPRTWRIGLSNVAVSSPPALFAKSTAIGTSICGARITPSQ